MEDKYEPKVGDKVRITKSDINWCSPNMDVFIGEVFTIREIEYDGGVKFIENPKKGFSHLSDWYWSYLQGHFEHWNGEKKKLKLKLKI